MFGICDLIVVSVLKECLKDLSENPWKLEFILGGFCAVPGIRDMVGQDYIKQCVEYITNNRLHVATFYELDMKLRPQIAVLSSGTESQQFLGEYGRIQESGDTLVSPVTYAEWDCSSIAADEMTVAAGYLLNKKLWPGMIVSNNNGSILTRIKSIVQRDGSTVVSLGTKLAAGTEMRGWKAVSDLIERLYEVNSSIDDVNVQCKLTTNGDFAIHRLLSLVLRYCLKRGRLVFDKYGLQVTTFSYSAPVSTDPDEHEYESIYSITGKFTDSWIYRDFPSNDSTANIRVELIAVPVDKTTNKEVKLEV